MGPREIIEKKDQNDHIKQWYPQGMTESFMDFAFPNWKTFFYLFHLEITDELNFCTVFWMKSLNLSRNF